MQLQETAPQDLQAGHLMQMQVGEKIPHHTMQRRVRERSGGIADSYWQASLYYLLNDQGYRLHFSSLKFICAHISVQIDNNIMLLKKINLGNFIVHSETFIKVLEYLRRRDQTHNLKIKECKLPKAAAQQQNRFGW